MPSATILSGYQTPPVFHEPREKDSSKHRFEITQKLGSGTYGKVSLAFDHKMEKEVAVKLIRKSAIENKQDLIRIRREIRIMSALHHPNITQIYEVFENRDKIIIIMEYASNGEVYDYVSTHGSLPESEARRLFRQIVSAVLYCHRHNVAHRDLKLENILLDTEGNAKIADFGLSNYFGENKLLKTFCGSPLYASPEIINGTPYRGPEVDCWSLGVLLYTLVYGSMPFDGRDFNRMVRQIKRGAYYEPETPSTASMLIRNMLRVEPKRRCTIEEIAMHWWLNLDETLPVIHDLPENQIIDPTPLNERAETVVVQQLGDEADVFMEFGHLSASTRKKIEEFRRRRMDAEKYINDTDIGIPQRRTDWCLATVTSQDSEPANDDNDDSSTRTDAPQVEALPVESGISTPRPNVNFDDPLSKLKDLEARLQFGKTAPTTPRKPPSPTPPTPVKKRPTPTSSAREETDEKTAPSFVSLDSANYERPSRWKLELDRLNMLMNQLLEEADKGRISMNLVDRIKRCPGYSTRPLVKELLESILLSHGQSTAATVEKSPSQEVRNDAERRQSLVERPVSLITGRRQSGPVATEILSPLSPTKVYRELEVTTAPLHPPEDEDEEDVTIASATAEEEASDFEELESVLDEQDERESTTDASDDAQVLPSTHKRVSIGLPEDVELHLPSGQQVPTGTADETEPGSAPPFFDRGLHKRQSRGKYAGQVDVYCRGLSADERDPSPRRIGGAQPQPADAPFLFDKAKQYILQFPQVTPTEDHNQLLLANDLLNRSNTPKGDDAASDKSATPTPTATKQESNEASPEIEDGDDEESEDESQEGTTEEGTEEDDECEDDISGDDDREPTKSEIHPQEIFEKRQTSPNKAVESYTAADGSLTFQFKLMDPPKGKKFKERTEEVDQRTNKGTEEGRTPGAAYFPAYTESAQNSSAARRRRLKERRLRSRTGDGTEFVPPLDAIDAANNDEYEPSTQLDALLSPRVFPSSPTDSPTIETNGFPHRLFADPRIDPNGSYSNAVANGPKPRISIAPQADDKQPDSLMPQPSGKKPLSLAAASDPFYEYFARHAPSLDSKFSYLSPRQSADDVLPQSESQEEPSDQATTAPPRSRSMVPPTAEDDHFDADEAADKLQVYQPRFRQQRQPHWASTNAAGLLSVMPISTSSSANSSTSPYANQYALQHPSGFNYGTATTEFDRQPAGSAGVKSPSYYRSAHDDNVMYRRSHYDVDNGSGGQNSHQQSSGDSASRRQQLAGTGRSMWLRSQSVDKNIDDYDGSHGSTATPTTVFDYPNNVYTRPSYTTGVGPSEPNSTRSILKGTPSMFGDTYSDGVSNRHGPGAGVSIVEQHSSPNRFRPASSALRFMDKIRRHLSTEKVSGTGRQKEASPFHRSTRYTHPVGNHVPSAMSSTVPPPSSSSYRPTYAVDAEPPSSSTAPSSTKKRNALNMSRRRTTEVTPAILRAAAATSDVADRSNLGRNAYSQLDPKKRPTSPFDKIKGFFRKTPTATNKSSVDRYSSPSTTTPYVPTTTTSTPSASFRNPYQPSFRPHSYVPTAGKHRQEDSTLY